MLKLNRLLLVMVAILMLATMAEATTYARWFQNTTGQIAYDLEFIMCGRVIDGASSNKFSSYQTWSTGFGWFTFLHYDGGTVNPGEWAWATFSSPSPYYSDILIAHWSDPGGYNIGQAIPTVSPTIRIGDVVMAYLHNDWTDWTGDSYPPDEEDTLGAPLGPIDCYDIYYAFTDSLYPSDSLNEARYTDPYLTWLPLSPILLASGDSATYDLGMPDTSRVLLFRFGAAAGGDSTQTIVQHAFGAAGIAGFKFHDVNGNSIYEPGQDEGPLPGVTINLQGTLDAGGTTSQSTVTDGQGGYIFNGLQPGDYWVLEDPGTYYQTYPLTVFHTIPDLQTGQYLTGYDFGNDTVCEFASTYETCLHGTDDGFVGPEPSYVSPSLLAYLQQQYDYITEFDQPAENQCFGHTFEGCWDDQCLVVAATLRMKLRATGGGAPSDWFYLGDFTYPEPDWRVYSISLNALETLAGGDGSWNNGDEMIVTLDLKNLPPRAWLPTNILSALQDGNLDFFFEDETMVDFIELSVELCCPDTCYADGDANGDDITLAVADLSYLIDFIHGNGQAPVPLYSCDLTGDGYVNQADIDLFNNYFIYGMSVFTNGYPVPCPCNSIGQPIPDTVNIFGLEHCSEAYACLEEVDNKLVVSRLMAAPAPEGIVIDIPDAISAPSSKCVNWNSEFENPDPEDSLPIGAAIEVVATGIIDGVPDEYVGSMTATKTDSYEWELTADLGAESYTVAAYNDNNVVFYQENIPATERRTLYFKIGKHHYWVHKPGHELGFIHHWKEPGKAPAQELEPCIIWRDSVLWTWPEQGVANLEIDSMIVIPENLTTEYGGLSEIGIYAQEMESFTITSESYAVDYKDVVVSNLGNAVMTPDDTTLIVSNIGSSGEDGVCYASPGPIIAYDKVVRCTMQNPDLGGTFPVGASIRALYEFAIDGQDDFPARLNFDFFGAGLWLLSTESTAGMGSVEAYNDDTLVFSIDSVSVGSLGHIVETTKGIHPVGFQGGSTGKPASIIAVQDAVWSWDTYGVYDLTVDEIHISYEVHYPSIGITKMSVRGRSAAKGDPISFKILDMQVEPANCCALRGDIDHNGTGPDIADLIYLVTFMFQEGPEPPCMEETDVNGDGTSQPDIADLIYLVSFMFQEGPDLIPCGQSAPKLISGIRPEAIELSVDFQDGVTEVFLASPIDLLGLQLELRGENLGEPELVLTEPLEMIYGHDGHTLKMGILDMRGAGAIGSGELAVVRIPGHYEVVRALAADRQLQSIEAVIVTAARVGSLPVQFALGQNYPNPFNPTTEIEFSLPVAGPAKLVVYNIVGQVVTTLVDETLSAGSHSATWDASSTASGVYFYRLTAGKEAESRKMMLLK